MPTPISAAKRYKTVTQDGYRSDILNHIDSHFPPPLICGLIQYDRSTPLLQEAVDIRRRTSPAPDRDMLLATALHLAAISLQKQSNGSHLAIPMMEEVLSIFKKALGKTHYQVRKGAYIRY